MNDLIWGAILGGLAYFFATHWDEIIDTLSNFFQDIANEFGISIGDLVNSFQSILKKFNNNVAKLVTKIYLHDSYGKSFVRTEVEEIGFDDIPDNLKNKVMRGYAVNVTDDVRQALIQEL
ncbi:MAG: hypothetical protein KBS60_00450 [Phascolarctobacterium sp.]|nr:hypothetical protein [Candidatus Phascolarctobacterium caballi]